jgi:hypothetical protein
LGTTICRQAKHILPYSQQKQKGETGNDKHNKKNNNKLFEQSIAINIKHPEGLKVIQKVVDIK